MSESESKSKSKKRKAYQKKKKNNEPLYTVTEDEPRKILSKKAGDSVIADTRTYYASLYNAFNCETARDALRLNHLKEEEEATNTVNVLAKKSLTEQERFAAALKKKDEYIMDLKASISSYVVLFVCNIMVSF